MPWRLDPARLLSRRQIGRAWARTALDPEEVNTTNTIAEEAICPMVVRVLIAIPTFFPQPAVDLRPMTPIVRAPH
jgi:hypothetical protein